MAENIKFLYAVHPDNECRIDMAKWFSDGSLVVEVVDRLGAHQALSVEMYYDTNLKKDLLKLIVPKDFTTYTTAEKDEDIMLEKYMVLYHEYIHLKNHFNGIWPIMGQDDEFIKKSMEAQAKYFWGNEYEAYKAQWGFMKRYQESRLMISRKDVAEKGEHKAWLDFFINTLRNNHRNRTDITKDQFNQMDRVWQNLYDSDFKSQSAH